MHNKKVLVTGGAGFVGSNLIERLLSKGAFVRATLHNKPPQIIDSRIDYVWGDLEDKAFCDFICKGADYVFLCAANTSGAAVMDKTPLVHLTPNLIMNARMLEAAYANNISKLLFISSNTVYPNVSYPVAESDAKFRFYDKYFIVGWMKRFSEIMCEMYSTKIKQPMSTVVVRPANLYGPRDDFEWQTSHVLPALIRRVVERHDPIKVWGDGSDIKDFVYVDDFIDAIVLLMSSQVLLPEFDVVNIASGHGRCLKDLLNLIIELDGYKNAKIEFDKTKPTMIPKRLIDPNKMFGLTGFYTKTPIEDGLKKTIEWYRQTIV